ncbi:hypothetical protein [Fluviicola taffensis]|uniref:Uncharacterized protein n=1 Tax=Fluviicola taffensis (strain DSM 16823 / NCIMB 13979 / RW262) TaxID=755732 RepID=F2IC67_FLUTR|nr:hypothetical protein [Fluviicola taffensis]AEA43293.1 hypothetical protein Fluta_1298 [Fluviicola taffensis DSM 16823]
MMEEKDLNILVQKLQLQLSQRKLLEKLQTQINKDFQRAGILDFELSDPDPKVWNGKIQTVLQKLSETQLQHLLYLIDIPELIVIQTNNHENRLFYLSNAILHRELMKVSFQIQFK